MKITANPHQNSRIGKWAITTVGLALSILELLGGPKAFAQTNVAKTKGMTASIIGVLERELGVNPAPLPNFDLCSDDGYCSFEFDDFGVNVYGAGLVELTTYYDVSDQAYLDVCSAILSGLTRHDIGLSRDNLTSAFRAAQRQGETKTDYYGVQIKIIPNYQGVLTCGFFKC